MHPAAFLAGDREYLRQRISESSGPGGNCRLRIDLQPTVLPP